MVQTDVNLLDKSARLPIQVEIKKHMEKNGVTREKFETFTGLSKNKYDCISTGYLYCPSRIDLLSICIGFKLSFKKIKKWMNIAGYAFDETYPYYQYECQIIEGYENNHYNFYEAIYQIYFLYGKTEEQKKVIAVQK